MAAPYWESQLTGFEPTTFPDLTGRSASARQALSTSYTAEHSLQSTNIKQDVVLPAHCVAAAAKVLTLYLGELDFCLNYLFQFSQSSQRGTKNSDLPLRIVIEPSSTIEEVLSKIDHDFGQAAQYGPPPQEILHKLLDSLDGYLSDILIVVADTSSYDHAALSEHYEKYGLVIEFIYAHTQDGYLPFTIKLRGRSSCLRFDDTPYVFSALEEALHLVYNKASSNFLSWTSNSEKIQKSVCNGSPEAAASNDIDTVHALFEHHAALRPDDIALDFLEDDQSRTKWTFGTLNSIANHIATELINTFNIQVEDSVPICVTKGPSFYACVLGVMKAGGVFTPFAGSPSERKKLMLEELSPKVILYAEGDDVSWAFGTKVFNISSIVMEGSKPGSGRHPEVKSPASSVNLCYQMYTSGSTGRPKAVSLEHRHAVQTACATSELVPWKQNSHLLQQAGVTFDMCYFEIFFAWKVGICLCSAPDSSIYNRLTDVINEMGVSLLGLTPSVALTLEPERVPGVEWMYCIGEALPQSLVDTWEGRLVNSYGPTEAAQMVTLFPVDREVKSTIIGQPFKNTSFTVLRKASTETVPIFGVGELCIGGYQVAREYYKNPEKTQQSFIEINGQKLYRTGDLVRMLGNKNFEFIGRIDDQVKIRGQRVELGEIDKSIEQSHHAVQRACTQVLKVSDNAKSQLVSFLVPKPATADDEHHLREAVEQYLSNSLPTYMVPKLFLFVDRIPLSLSNKVDKRALTDILRESDQVKSVQPNTSHNSDQNTPQILQQIYSESCGLPSSQVAYDVSIYQLGIDSISAIQIAHKLKARGWQVQPSDVLNYPTIAQLSQYLGSDSQACGHKKDDEDSRYEYDEFDAKHRFQVAKQIDISAAKIAQVRPASPLQTSMVTLSMQSSEPLYFNHLTYQLPKDMDLERFTDAWEAVISNREILRCGFVTLNDGTTPIAMITYHARAFVSPISRLTDDSTDLSDETSRFAQSAIKQMQVPPWQVLVSPQKGQFYFSAHHALYDAQVLDLLMRDLALAYDGLHLPQDQSLGPHLARFLNANPVDEKQVQFWQGLKPNYMATTFPQLSPLLEDKRKIQRAAGVSACSLSQLEKGCRSSGVTMQAAAQTAWGYLLAAITGEDAVTFGTVLSGRVAEDSEEVSFPMITTVPTAVNRQKSRKDSVNDLLRYNAEVQQFQFLPLTKIQKLLGYAGVTFFDTIFTFQKRSQTEYSGGTRFEFVDNDLDIEYPVSVELEPIDSDRLQFTIFYQSRYMQPEQASLIVKQFHYLLQAIIFENDNDLTPMVEDADSSLFSITPAQQEFLPSNRSLMHHSVEMTALENPDKTAIEFVTSLEDAKIVKRSWSFRELDEEGNKIAHYLLKAGVIQGSIVAICFDKCPEATFSMLGIAKAGCSFLALDPGAPFERKKFIMQDSQAALLLSNRGLVDDLKTCFSEIVIDLGMVDLSNAATSPVSLPRPIDPQDTAYCLYTSGTTGTPKGCLVTHENVIQVFLCFEKLYKHDEHSRWLQFASYHFDVSVMEHFWSWFVGITVVKASRDLILQDLANAISMLKISHIDLTPSLARLLDPDDVPTLAKGVFVTGGEMLRRDIIEAWGHTGAIHNAYGPTEATIGVTMYPHVPKNGRPSNIGWPFYVVGTFVVQPSDATRPVLRGGVGELLVTGKLVAEGYLRRDELTAQRFITIGGQKCYKTGDLVRVVSDGSIEFLGRADDQVKLRGQRLETGEINNVIKQGDDDIDDVTTLVLKHPKQQKEQLVSFVAVRSASDQKGDLALCDTNHAAKHLPRVRAACVDRLPGYMVPTHILFVNKMPLSANNKVEARQLRSLYENIDLGMLHHLASDTQSGETSSANNGDIEQISKILSKALGVDIGEVAATSSFYELGLDSISMIGFSRALKSAGFDSASPSLIMRHASASKLAAAIRGAESQTENGSVRAALQMISAYNHRYKSLAVSVLQTQYENIETVMPCTALQAGIISRSLETTQGLYFTAFHFNLTDAVDLAKLQEACQRVCDHVQMLRTQFVPTEDGYIQVVQRDKPCSWVELEVKDENELATVLHDTYQHWWKSNGHEILRPFELVVVKTPIKTTMTLHIFHALYDGNSLPLIMDAVTNEYYNSHEMKYGPAFSEALPYGPLRKVQGAEGFWMNHLSSLSNVPKNKLKPLAETKSRKDINVTHYVKPIRDLENCRRQLNVTHQAIMQACWTVLLQEIMEGPTVLGIIVSGRSIDFEAADKVIGPLFNTIPFFLPLSDQDTWRSIITKAHEFNSSALVHQHTPLRDIRKWAKKHQIPIDLFDTLFVFQKELKEKPALKPLWTLQEETFEADYPLAFEVVQEADGGFDLTLACQGFMSDEEASKALLQRFERTLQIMINNLDTPLTQFIKDDVIFERHLHSPITNRNANRYTNGGTNGNVNGNGNGAHPSQTTNGNGTNSNPNTNTLKTVCNELLALADVESDEVQANTSIFEVGLDSIDAVKLSSRLKKTTGAQIPVSQIMRLLTVSAIATAVDEKGQSNRQPEQEFDLDQTARKIEQSVVQSGLNMSNIEKVLPCTPLQEGMVADMLNSDFERYLNFDVLKLKRDTNADTLQRAWTKVIETFPILRTQFVDVTDPYVDCTIAQVVLRPSDTDFSETAMSIGSDFTEVYASIRQEVKRNYSKGSALRLTLIQDPEDDGDRYLVLTLPHAMYDGWSLAIIHESVRQVYHGAKLDVHNYETALRNILDSSGKSSQQFWRQQLLDVKVTIFPSKRNQRTVHRRSKHSPIPLINVQKFCRHNKVTIAALCQMVWSVVLAYYTRQLDVCFAQVLSGRTDETANDVIFPTMNTIISRTVLHGTRSEMVQYLQEGLSAVSEHQHFPLRKALALLSGKNSKEVFNTLFIYQKSIGDANSSAAELYESIDSASNVEYPVCVEAEVAENQLIWRTACEESCLNEVETEGILEHLDNVLEAVISFPENDVAEFSGNKVQLCQLPSFELVVEDSSKPADQSPNKDASTDEHAAWSETQTIIGEVVASVAQVDINEVNKQTNLFGIGLDSISTIKVSSLLRKKGIKVSVNDLLSAGTIEKIASLNKGETVERIGHAKTSSKPPSLSNGDNQDSEGHRLLKGLDINNILTKNKLDLDNVEQVLPVTGGQMLLLCRWQNEDVYYSSLDFAASGCKDIGRLRSAWSALVERTSMLRTIFLATGEAGIPVVQVTLKKVQPQFTDIPSGSSLEQVANTASSGQGALPSPPCALFAQACEGDYFELALKISHALYDGFFLKAMIATLQDLINNPALPTYPNNYSHAHYLTSIASSASKQQFWTSYLSDVNFLSLPPSRSRGSKNGTKQYHIVRADVLSTLSPLRNFARKNQVSVQALLLASYATTHAHRLRQHYTKDKTVNDVLIGIFMANRNDDGADELAAPTLGFAPVRVRQPLERSLVDIAKGMQHDMQEISEDSRSQIGLYELQDWISPQIKVDVWVNILRHWVPDELNNNTEEVQVITGEKSQDLEKQYNVKRTDEDVQRGLLLKNNAVRHCYDYPMMDLEATVKEDNLDIGIQAPSTLLDADEAKEVIIDVAARLRGLTD